MPKRITRLFNENCMETMARFSDKEMDMIITSPPYNMNLRVRNGKYCSRQITKEFSNKYEGFDDNFPIEDFYRFHIAALREMIRVSKVVFYNIQIVTGSKRAFFRIMGDLNEYLKEVIVWDKGHGQPAMAPNCLNRQTELILVFEEPNESIRRTFDMATFARGTMSDSWHIKRGPKKIKSHGATFPEELVERIITNFSQTGQKVYDPFLGTGTTCLIAKRLGRQYFGSELSEKYFKIAKERIKNEISKRV